MGARKKITVLGCGLVGSVMANDLAKQHEVTVVDFNPDAFERLSQDVAHHVQLDLSASGAVAAHLASNETDIVVGAVPGFM
ncbi:MAG: NAD-binding protein, partial [Flavobacteriales bacterium]